MCVCVLAHAHVRVYVCVVVCMFVVDVQNELHAQLPSDSEDEPGSILDALLQVAVCQVSI